MATQHPLARMLGRDSDTEFYDHLTEEDSNRVWIAGNWMFSVGTLRVNYTTYNICREQDTVNPRTYPFVMVKTGETKKMLTHFGMRRFWGYFMLLCLIRVQKPRRDPPSIWNSCGYIGWALILTIVRGLDTPVHQRLALFLKTTLTRLDFWIRHTLSVAATLFQHSLMEKQRP